MHPLRSRLGGLTHDDTHGLQDLGVVVALSWSHLADQIAQHFPRDRADAPLGTAGLAAHLWVLVAVVPGGDAQLAKDADEGLSQRDALACGDDTAAVRHLGIELGEGRIGDVLFLDRGVDHDLGRHIDRRGLDLQRGFQDALAPVHADALPEAGHLAGVAGQRPLEVGLAAKELPVGVLLPTSDQGVVAEIVEVFEDRQADHPAQRQRRPTAGHVLLGQCLYQNRPGHLLG